MAKGKEMIVNQSPYVIHFEEHARKRFISHGVVSDASSNLSSSFIVPFAQTLKATTSQIGFLSAFSGLLSPLGSLLGSKLMEKHSRKKILLRYTLLESVMLVPMFLLIYLFWNNLYVPVLPYVLIVVYSLFVFFSGVKSPPFFSWIGDVVSSEDRGHYFARRNRITGIFGLGAFLAGGLVLRFFEKGGDVLVGYIILFGVALVLRIVSFHQLRTVFSPQLKLHKKDKFSMIAFLKRYDTIGKFAVFQALFNFSIMVASPFFATYMLKDLNFNLLTFTIVTLSTTVFYLILTPLAGKLSDKYGNLKLLYIAGFAFPLTPLFWMFLKDPVFLILIPGFISGAANAAFTIGSTNYIYDGVSQQKRGIIVAYSSVLNGIGVFAGSILGGLMIDYLPITFMSSTLFVFALAAVLRFIVVFSFLPRLEEVRKTERIKGLNVDFHHPFRMVHSDVVWFKKLIREK